jgi:hypothetical protein
VYRVIAGIVVGAAISASVALGAGGGGQAITACYSKHGGTLHLLTHGSCKHGQGEISWNKTGATGVPGATGGVGATGPPGATGGAVAYAEVSGGSSPSLIAGRTSGFTSVSVGNNHAYCLVPAAGVSAGSTTAVVTPIYYSPYAGTPQYAYLVSPTAGGDCPTSDFEVLTFGNSTTPVNQFNFSIVVY